MCCGNENKQGLAYKYYKLLVFTLTSNIGQRNGLVAQILYGVSEGEAVVNHPSDDVEDGRRVKQRL